MHPATTAAAALVDRSVLALDPVLDEAASVAAALAGAASRAGVTSAQVRAWLGGDYSEAHAILVRHGTPGSYASAHALAAHVQAPERVWAVADLIGDALTDAEHHEGCAPSYDYFQDPRPQWVVRLTWPTGRTSVDYIKAANITRATQRATWNWPDAVRAHVSFDHEYEALRTREEAAAEDSMWDYTPRREEIE